MTATTPQVASGDPALPAWHRWLVLLVMSLGTLVVFLDNTVVNTALPAISIDLGASITTLQWIVDAYVLALVGLLLLGGTLGDRYGRRARVSPTRRRGYGAEICRVLSARAVHYFNGIDVLAGAVRIGCLVVVPDPPAALVGDGILTRHEPVGIGKAQQVRKLPGGIPRA